MVYKIFKESSILGVYAPLPIVDSNTDLLYEYIISMGEIPSGYCLKSLNTLVNILLVCFLHNWMS